MPYIPGYKLTPWNETTSTCWPHVPFCQLGDHRHQFYCVNCVSTGATSLLRPPLMSRVWLWRPHVFCHLCDWRGHFSFCQEPDFKLHQDVVLTNLNWHPNTRARTYILARPYPPTPSYRTATGHLQTQAWPWTTRPWVDSSPRIHDEVLRSDQCRDSCKRGLLRTPLTSISFNLIRSSNFNSLRHLISKTGCICQWPTRV